MRLFVLALSLSLSLAQQCGQPGPADAANQIINGVDASVGELPWQLGLERQGILGGYGHSCGAVLLSDSWAFTACHCVSGGQDDAADIRLVAGQHKRSDPESGKQILNVETVTLHPQCNLGAPGVPYDYAILKLANKADLSSPNVNPICLPSKDANFTGNPNCWISGWGRISGDPDNNDLGDTLQKGKTNVLSLAQCKEAMQPVQGAEIGPHHVCSQNQQSDMGACNGDSGGPLQCRNTAGNYDLVGVASWVIITGEEDCVRTFPNAYANVPFVVDWIKQITGLS